MEPKKYKGVRQKARGRGVLKWLAEIRYAGKYVYIGDFDTAEEAARAYNKAALRLVGPKAKLNEIPS